MVPGCGCQQGQSQGDQYGCAPKDAEGFETRDPLPDPLRWQRDAGSGAVDNQFRTQGQDDGNHNEKPGEAMHRIGFESTVQGEKSQSGDQYPGK